MPPIKEPPPSDGPPPERAEGAAAGTEATSEPPGGDGAAARAAASRTPVAEPEPPPRLSSRAPERRAPVKLPWRVRALSAIVCLAVTVALVPRTICGCAGASLYDGDEAAQDALARNLAASILAHPGATFYPLGADLRFEGQSALAAYQMTILGLGQIVLEHPEKRDAYLPAIRAAADRLVDPATLKYAARVYGSHASVRMGPGAGHAYAGYINLALGMLRLVDPETKHAALHDRLSRELGSRLFHAPNGLFETYPGEMWPPDVAVVAGSIGLHARATGLDIRKDMDAWAERFEKCAVHASGYLIQRVRSGTCAPADAPRGSGTAIASYAIGFAHPGLSRKLHDALVQNGRITLLGFGGLREYAPGFNGAGDTNAGPILLGASVGATGFGLGAARMNGDRDLYVALYRSAHLFGIPAAVGDGTSFALGGVLGNALLLAMLTAKAP